MSSLETHSTTNANCLKRCYKWMCRCDISDHSWDESIPMIVRNGELVKLGKQSEKIRSRSHPQKVCICCCRKQRYDNNIDTGKEHTSADGTLRYGDRQVSFEESCLSPAAEEPVGDLTDSDRYARFGSSPFHLQSQAFCHILKFPTNLSPNLKTDNHLRHIYQGCFTHNNFPSQEFFEKVTRGMSKTSLHLGKYLAEDTVGALSRSVNDYQYKNKFQYNAKIRISENPMKEVESGFVHQCNDIDRGKNIQKTHYIQEHLFNETSQVRDSLKENHCGCEFPVEISENSDHVCESNRRKKIRGAFYRAEATKTALMSLFRSLPIRRKSRGENKYREDSDSDSYHSHEDLLGIEKQNYLETSSDEDIFNMKKNRNKKYRKSDLKSTKKISVKSINKNRCSVSVPTLKEHEGRFSSKFISEQALHCKRDNMGEYYELIELKNAHGDSMIDADESPEQQFTKIYIDRTIKTYADKENQCNIIGSDIIGINEKFSDKLTSTIEDKTPLQRENQTVHVGVNSLFDEANIHKVGCSRKNSSADPLLITDDSEIPHHFVLKPSRSKSESNFFTKYDPSIHGVHRSPTRDRRIRSGHSNEIKKKSISTLTVHTDGKPDPDSQTVEELTSLLMKLPIKEELEKSMARNSKQYTVGYALRNEFNASEMVGQRQPNHRVLQDASTLRLDHTLDEKSSKKKLKCLWSLSSVFKKHRNSKYMDAPDAETKVSVGVLQYVAPRWEGLPQMQGGRLPPPEERRKGGRCPRCGRSRDRGGGGRTWDSFNAGMQPRSLATVLCPERSSVNGSKPVANSPPHSKTLPATVFLRRRRIPTLSQSPLEGEVSDHREDTTPGKEVERRSKYVTWCWFDGYDGDMCPFKDFQTW